MPSPLSRPTFAFLAMPSGSLEETRFFDAMAPGRRLNNYEARREQATPELGEERAMMREAAATHTTTWRTCCLNV